MAEQRRVTYTGARQAGSRPASGVSRPASGVSRPVSGVSRPVSGVSRPVTGRGASLLPYTGEEDLEQLRQKYVLLEGDRRAYYETSQWTMKQNRETVLMLKKENKNLKKDLSEVNSKKKGDALRPSEKEIKLLEKKVHELRSLHDKLSRDRVRGGEKLVKVKENLQTLEKDKNSLMEVDNPVLRSIRTLENRLDKAMVKHNEAASINRTYDSIVKRLKEERLTFDSQLKAVEEAVKAKTLDLQQLNQMAMEAQVAKEQAMSELRGVEVAVERERAHRQHELQEREAQVEAAEAQRAGGDPEALARCQEAAATYDEAFKRVQEETGVVDLHEFAERFIGQDGVRQDLKDMETDFLLKIDILNRRSEDMQAKIDELRLVGSGNTSTREEMDSLHEAIKEATADQSLAKAEHDKLGRRVVNIRAGLAHLADLLSDIPKGKTSVSRKSSGSEMVDQLLLCGDKLAYAIGVCGRDPHALQALAQLRDDPSCFYDPTTSPPDASPDDSLDLSPDLKPSSSMENVFPSEDMDGVIGVGHSIANVEELTSTSGVTKSVVMDRQLLKMASMRLTEDGQQE